MSEATQQTAVDEEVDGGVLGADLDESIGPDVEVQVADSAAPGEVVMPSGDFDPNTFDWLSGNIAEVPDEYKPLQKVARQQQSILNRTNMDLRNQEKRMREQEERYIRVMEGSQDKNEQGAVSPESDSVLSELGITPESEGYDAASAVESIAKAIFKPYMERLTGVESGLGRILQSYQNTQQQQQQQQQTQIQAEIDEATAAHGDAIWKMQDDIAYFRGKTNADTGRPYTVLQAYEKANRYNGDPAQTPATSQPNRTGPGPRSVPSNTAPAGSLDPSDVLNGLKNLGFE